MFVCLLSKRIMPSCKLTLDNEASNCLLHLFSMRWIGERKLKLLWNISLFALQENSASFASATEHEKRSSRYSSSWRTSINSCTEEMNGMAERRGETKKMNATLAWSFFFTHFRRLCYLRQWYKTAGFSGVSTWFAWGRLQFQSIRQNHLWLP